MGNCGQSSLSAYALEDVTHGVGGAEPRHDELLNAPGKDMTVRGGGLFSHHAYEINCGLIPAFRCRGYRVPVCYRNPVQAPLLCDSDHVADGCGARRVVCVHVPVTDGDLEIIVGIERHFLLDEWIILDFAEVQ
jgi:hypothetical protein